MTVHQVPGTLSDHYDPERGQLRLSGPVATGASVAALGVAAHEVGHAAQEAEGYAFNRARHRVGRLLARISPFVGMLLLGGFVLGIALLAAASAAALALMALFALVTLPVELDASRRAAALTYLTKLASRVGVLLFLLVGVVSVGQLG